MNMKLWNQLIGWTEGISWIDVLFSIGIILICLLSHRMLVKHLTQWLAKRFKGTEDERPFWVQAFEKPFDVFIVTLGFYLGIEYLIPAESGLDPLIDRIFRSFTIMLIGWGIYNLSATSSALLEGLSKRVGLDHSSMIIPFLSKTLRFVIIVMVAAAVGADWGFSIDGVVAGMGLGSLAIALAAKDSLSNIFGGIVIIVEKPFSKGDWILTPSGEGIVEDITFRSTQIRTFADSVVIIPNSTLSNQPITNWSRMGKRRVSFTLDVALDSDRERLNRAITRIKNMLTNNPLIDQNLIMVNFNEFKQSSLGIFIYFFTATTVWAEYLNVRQELNFEILKILDEEGVRLAYPTQRLFVEEVQQERGQVFSSRNLPS